MSYRDLEKIFEPETIAVLGASEEKGTKGHRIMENLRKSWEGEIYPINPNQEKILGIESFSKINQIPDGEIDLGVIALPGSIDPDILDDFGEKRVRGLIIISSSFESQETGKNIGKVVEEKKKKYEMRILGPNSWGVINPFEGLNVSLANQVPEPGEITFISQSNAIASATLDWAISARIGFSSFVSVGDAFDVGFGDLIDYFGRDPDTSSILMYIERVRDSQKFMSAARGVARTKPIMAFRSGHFKEETIPDVFSRSRPIVSSDDVYEGAFKRAGITRVDTIGDLFTCSELLARHNPPDGSRLAIVTNAVAPGIMAADALDDLGGELVSLSGETVEQLGEFLSSGANLENPVNVDGDFSSDDYRKSVEVCLEDENVDGLLCIYAPSGSLSPEEAAKAIAGLKKTSDKPILSCWMGGKKTNKGREVLRKHGFSIQSNPEQSVRAYMYLDRYARNLERLLETPEELPVDREPPKYNLKAMIRRAAKNDRKVLTETESKKVLRIYGISSPEMHEAESQEEAVRAANRIGYPIVMKINSPDIIQKSSIDGVKLNLTSESEVRESFEEIIDKVKENYQSAEINGVTVQKMIPNPELELILGSRKDPVFGASIIFGRGGKGVEYYDDISVGLPPLNQTLASHIMEATEVYKQIKELHDNPSQILRTLEEHLVMFSQMVIDFPEIEAVNINPLVSVGDDFTALDARIIIDKDLALTEEEGREHLVIEPYPRKYIEEWKLDDGRSVTLRPIRPEDEPLEFELFDTFSKKTWRYRFFGPMKEVTHEDMVRYTNIDYRREMAIIGVLEEKGERKMIGVGRLIINPGGDTGEFAVVVGDPWQGLGLGEKLTDSVIGVAEDKGLDEIWATIMKKNVRMINLCKKLGFKIKEEGEDTVKATLKL